MKHTIYKTFEIDIYKVKLHLIVIKDNITNVIKEFGLTDEGKEINEQSNAFCEAKLIDRQLNLFLIFRTDYFTPFYITHEVFHAVGYIANSVNIIYDFDNEEPLAYLNGYINELLLKEYLELVMQKIYQSNKEF
jgi:hypothetical protein